MTKIFLEKAIKNSKGYQEFFLFQKQTKRHYIQWNFKISIYLLLFNLDVFINTLHGKVSQNSHW